MTPPADRHYQLKLLLSDEERSWLEQIATAKGLSSADVIRMQIREQHAALFEDGALVSDVLRKLTAKPKRPTDLMNELGAEHGPLGMRINPALTRLVQMGYAEGQPVTGFTVTKAGRKARGE